MSELIKEVQHTLKLMPKQAQFVFDDAHWEILYSGAFGAGKSRALCCRAVRLAQYPGARVGLVRKTLADLKASTLITLLEPDGELPPVLHPDTYTFHKAESWIEIHNGGTIVLFGCDDQAKVGSRPLTDICIDEGIELEKEEYTMLLGRRRGKYRRPDGKENTRSICVATNPGPPTHFLFERFFNKQHPRRLLIETNTAENYYLPEDYRQSMNELEGTARDRYYLGRWVAFEGAVYPMFDSRIHLLSLAGTKVFDHYIIGLDWGFQNPCAVRVHGCVHGSRKSHVVAEYHKNHTPSPEFVEICKVTAKAYSPCTFVVDPSAADLKAQMRNVGLNVIDGNNDVFAGIRCVQASLLPAGDSKEPELTMEPSCKAGNDEYTSYRWKDGVLKEQPVKEHDHALDADRYARMHITRGFGQARLTVLGRDAQNRTNDIPGWGILHSKEVDEDDDRWWGGSDDQPDHRVRDTKLRLLT